MTNHLRELKRKGNRALVARNYEQAKTVFGTLIAESPDSPEGYLGLAKVLERTHEHRAVIDLIEPIIHRVRSDRLLRALGDAYRVLANQGDPAAVDAAIRWYEAYHRERSDPVTLYHLGELYREHKGDYGKALGYLELSWRADPGSRTVYQAALACAERLGLPDEVLRLKKEWKEHGRE